MVGCRGSLTAVLPCPYQLRRPQCGDGITRGLANATAIEAPNGDEEIGLILSQNYRLPVGVGCVKPNSGGFTPDKLNLDDVFHNVASLRSAIDGICAQRL